jgi:hypothetical protein
MHRLLTDRNEPVTADLICRQIILPGRCFHPAFRHNFTASGKIERLPGELAPDVHPLCFPVVIISMGRTASRTGGPVRTVIHFTLVSPVLPETLEYRVIPYRRKVIFEYVPQSELFKTVKKVAWEHRTVGQEGEFPDSPGTTDPVGEEISAEA